MALNFGSLVGGAVVTESVFNWPALRLLVDSVRYRDYPSFRASAGRGLRVVIMNLLGELLIALLNPKIRFE
ncbi:ABC transporter permease subunit [Rouxiella badensis]|uniref:ABC transporter permease subunit n=1 Tax=Rouxiella badensis TaxID=1646377 RepID=UPI001CE43F74|nr:ABC transporter permease subunit [Rouxiella badensis]